MKLASWRDAIPVAREWAAYQQGAPCSCWHVVMEDENLADGFILLGIDHALQANHDVCYRLGATLVNMSTTQRGRLLRNNDEWRWKNPFSFMNVQNLPREPVKIFTVPPGQSIPLIPNWADEEEES